MAAVAEAIARPTAYPTKYFGFELGAQTTCDEKNDKWIVNGKHDQEDLARLLDNFIEEYVLCRKCRNPETVMEVRKEGIFLKCAACSASSPVNLKHRIAVYIQKMPPSTKTQYDKQAQQQQNIGEEEEGMGSIDDIDINGEPINDEDDDEDDWKADFSESAVEKRRRELLGGSGTNLLADGEDGDAKKVDPVQELAEFLTQPTLPSDIDILKKIKLLATENFWKPTKIVQYVFNILFTPPIMSKLDSKCHLLSLVVQDSLTQQVVLFYLEKLGERESTVVEQVTNILNALYDEGVLDEEIILKWHKHPTKKIEPNTAKAIRVKAQPFIDWLMSSDSDDDDSDEDDEE